MSFPGGAVVKNLPANAGDTRDARLIPGLSRFPGGGNGSPLQDSCWDNPTDRGAWWATIHGVTKSQTWLNTIEQNVEYDLNSTRKWKKYCTNYRSLNNNQQDQEIYKYIPPWYMDFPGGSDRKASAYNAGDLGLIPGSGRSTGEGNGNPLQDYCLENPMNRGTW